MTQFGARALAIVDVGHGCAAVIRDGDWVAVVDTGRGTALLEFLKEHDVSTINEVLLSHSDEDHIGGLVGLLSSGEFKVLRVRLNSDALKGSKIWEDLIVELDRAGASGEVDFLPVLTVAQSGQFDHADVHLEILSPSLYLAAKGPGGKDRNGRRITTNSISAVVRVRDAEHGVVLLAGDLDEVGADEMLRSQDDLRCGVLVFPHHGGGGSAGFVVELVGRVNPQSVVFSIGRGVHNTPDPMVVSSVMNAAPTARVMCTELSDRCTAVPPKSAATHLLPVYSRGKERGACCTGTIVVELAAPYAVSPSYDSHRAFIEAHAPGALCQSRRQ